MSKILTVFKLAFTAALFVIFMALFAVPNVLKYLDNASMTLETYATSTNAPIEAPAILVCAINPRTGMGWKNATVGATGADFYQRACGETEAENITKCIIENTFPLKQSILNYTRLRGFQTFDSQVPVGLCQLAMNGSTILPFGDSFGNSGLAGTSLTLNHSLDHFINFFDRRFFFMSTNAEAVPGFRMTLKAQSEPKQLMYNLRVVKYSRRRTTRNPCNEENDYSFSACLTYKVESLVGCSPAWNTNKVSHIFTDRLGALMPKSIPMFM